MLLYMLPKEPTIMFFVRSLVTDLRSKAKRLMKKSMKSFPTQIRWWWWWWWWILYWCYQSCMALHAITMEPEKTNGLATKTTC